ncbi:solute carrier family 2 member 11, like isoform X1 [Nelusetta ayraudi]|uniref:solute carrier family 2 member 11, like isoform X1 n=1 Tax=Nelusetta ayraudi TaxID=303726 RepID=UPI003F71515B
MAHSLKLLLECPTIIAVIFVTGIGGTFQYGFCVSVLNAPSAYIKELVNLTCLQRYDLRLDQWQVSLIWSFTVSIFCIGGLLGTLSAGPLMTRHGRKRCLLLNNLVAIAGAVLMILSSRATSFEMIMVGRFLYGINAGVSLSAHTLYLVECAPKRLRGMMGVTVATFVSLGKFSGQLLGISELLGSRQRWPWLLGFNGLTALLQLCTLPFLPESPRFLLLERGDQQACERALRRLWGSGDYRPDLEEMLQEKVDLQKVRSRSVLELLLDRTVRWQLLTIVVVFITLQLCGINAVYFYSYDIFRAAGIQEEQLSYTALGTGLCELTVSLCCCMMIETTGKKVLLHRGYTGMSTSMVLLTVTLYFQASPLQNKSTFLFIFLFVLYFLCTFCPITRDRFVPAGSNVLVAVLLHCPRLHDHLLLLQRTSWSHNSDSWRNINPVVQIGWIHRGLHAELDEPVRGGDGLPHPGEVSAELLLPHIHLLLRELQSVCEVQRPGDQEQDHAGDQQRV